MMIIIILMIVRIIFMIEIIIIKRNGDQGRSCVTMEVTLQ